MDEKGMVVVETLISFLVFSLMTVFIVIFVNLAAVQLRVHYALTQTAKELSVYCYALQMTGVTDALRNVESLAAERKSEINGVIGNAFSIFDAYTEGKEQVNNVMDGGSISDAYDGLKNSINTVKTNGSAAMGTFKSWWKNPSEFFRGLLWVGLQKGADTGLDALFAYVMAPFFFEKYMDVDGGPDALVYMKSMAIYANGYNDGEESIRFAEWTDSWDSALSGLRAEGLDGVGLTGSHFLSQGRADEITIQVTYTINLGAIIALPKSWRKPEVVQQVKVKAWVGDGGSYKRK